MSSVFRMSKSKVTQEELRRMMRSQKQQQEQETKIDSPLARYEGSKLTCAVCRCPVAAKAWRAHLNSAKHANRVEETRQLHRKAVDRKRPATPPPLPDAKKIRGILKNAPPRPLDPDENQTPMPPVSNESNAVSQENEDCAPAKAEADDTIPEGFFDDPIMDAKARNIQYKDPIEEEWEKFQKEMKEENDLSAAIIAGEQEEATAERQIDEIEEQMRNLSKVLDLNRKKEEAAKQKALEEAASMDKDTGSSDDDEEFEEYLDWRAKKSYR